MAKWLPSADDLVAVYNRVFTLPKQATHDASDALLAQYRAAQVVPSVTEEELALKRRERAAVGVLVAAFGDMATKASDPSRYPHICPRCKGPAYVGAVEVDCAGGCK